MGLQELMEETGDAEAVALELKEMIQRVREGCDVGGAVPNFVGEVRVLLDVLENALIGYGLRVLIDDVRDQMANTPSDGKRQ